MKLIEKVVVKYTFAVGFLLSAVVIIGYIAVVRGGVITLDELSKYVDAIFKSTAVLVGAVWSLNRYFVERTDAPQIRVDDDVQVVRVDKISDILSPCALLIYRMDVVNTGKVVIPEYRQYCEIDSIVPTSEGIESQPLYRWPVQGWHDGGPIEPGSWSAINNVIMVPANTIAVRFYLELRLSDGKGWNWHKTFDVSGPHRPS